MSPIRPKPTVPLTAAAIVFAILVADILLAKIQVMIGESNPLHIGDTAQFILLLLAVVLFVIGTLHKETLAGGPGKRDRKWPPGDAARPGKENR